MFLWFVLRGNLIWASPSPKRVYGGHVESDGHLDGGHIESDGHVDEVYISVDFSI